MLRAGAMEDGALRRSVSGTPQGGVISPLLANVYLDRLDRSWEVDGTGVLVRYADDLVVMCRSEAEARGALVALRGALALLGLDLNEAKTQIVHLREGGEGLDFLGFHHRWVRGRSPRTRHFCFLARWPSRKASQHARDRIREITATRRLLLPVEQIVEELNRFLRGWGGYFRYGNSAHALDRISGFAAERLARFVARRSNRSSAYGWSVLHHQSQDRLGLVALHGTVIAPRPGRAWRGSSNAAGEGRR
jgi:RNA-directed DNA polymerase